MSRKITSFSPCSPVGARPVRSSLRASPKPERSGATPSRPSGLAARARPAPPGEARAPPAAGRGRPRRPRRGAARRPSRSPRGREPGSCSPPSPCAAYYPPPAPRRLLELCKPVRPRGGRHGLPGRRARYSGGACGRLSQRELRHLRRELLRLRGDRGRPPGRLPGALSTSGLDIGMRLAVVVESAAGDRHMIYSGGVSLAERNARASAACRYDIPSLRLEESWHLGLVRASPNARPDVRAGVRSGCRPVGDSRGRAGGRSSHCAPCRWRSGCSAGRPSSWRSGLRSIGGTR